MASVLIVLVLLVVVWYVLAVVRRRRGSIVAKRGLSIGADLGTLSDRPTVRIRSVTNAGVDRVRLILTPDASSVDAPGPELDLVVLLRDDEFGFDLLNEWERSDKTIAIVMPPDSRIVRLRSIDDLQPLTLRRVDEA